MATIFDSEKYRKVTKNNFIEPKINDYVREHALRLNSGQEKLIQHTLNQPGYAMLGNREMVQLFQIMLKSMNAKRAIEVGCFTGYTACSLAQALPDDGEVVTLDITDEVIDRNTWKDMAVDNKVKLVLGPGVDSLNQMVEQGESGKFDFAFIDADKDNYPIYYEKCLQLVRKGGIIALDNMLRGGQVTDKEAVANKQEIKILDELNKFIKADDRVDITLLAIGDGVTICCKK